MTRDTNIYSRILNDENSMELIVDYNDMAVGLEMLNAKKDVNANLSASKKMEQTIEMAKNKSAKNSEETNKQNKMLPGFQVELQKHAIDVILSFPDAWM